ncbi:MAG: antitoxin [Microbacteriaceae bacterium]|nr:antitoxin [Cryobacterium sp.]MCC6375820.1 antitoxin [Microbacteriaceae bacterium]
MGIDDIINDAKDAVKSEQAEEISDNILDGAENLIDKVTGGKFAEQVDDVRDAIDKKIGNE